MSRPFVSASRRTDIPAWYATWFLNRVKAGFCMTRNPFRPSQTFRISLAPQDVRAIFFWTRWPVPLVKGLDLLDSMGHRYLFHFTLTGLGPPLEPFGPSLEERINAFARLADRIGPDRVWWRYDPIIMGQRLDADFHLANFDRLSKALENSTRRVTMSMVDWYRKTERRLSPLETKTGPLHRLDGNEPQVLDLVRNLGLMARSRGMTPVSCCEPDFAQAGIPPGACIDAQAVNTIFALNIASETDPGQRPHCSCAPSFDIGAPHTCIAGCAYCYSTTSHESALANHQRHAPESEFLLEP